MRRGFAGSSFVSPVFTGTGVFRQTGGVAGTDEIQVYHDGTRGYVQSMDGELRLIAAGGVATGTFQFADSVGNVRASVSNIAGQYTDVNGVSVGGGGTATAINTTGLDLINTGVVSWRVSAGGAIDTGLARLAAGVVKATDGSTGLGWLQTDGKKRTSTAPTNATASMSNLTDLSVPVVAGRKYAGFLVVVAKNSIAAEGLQFDFAGGSATFTSFQANIVGTPIGVTLGVTTATANNTALTATVATTTDVAYLIYVSFVVNAAGTFIPRFAEVSHASGTATVEIGSTVNIDDLP